MKNQVVFGAYAHLFVKNIMPKRGRSSDVGEHAAKKARSSVQVLVEQATKTFRENANSRDAAPRKKYMRGQFEFFGLKTPQRKALGKNFLQENLEPSEMRDLVKLLWQRPERELQYFALDYIEKHIKTFADNPGDFDANVDCIKDMILKKSWWDTVDRIASNVVGYLVKKHPLVGRPLMEEWIDDDNLWLRRTAILHQLTFKQHTDEKLLFKFCSARAHEEEFFIRKAIGWALRNHARFSAKAVKRYLLQNKQSLSKLSYKEASKHMSGM